MATEMIILMTDVRHIALNGLTLEGEFALQTSNFTASVFAKKNHTQELNLVNFYRQWELSVLLAFAASLTLLNCSVLQVYEW